MTTNEYSFFGNDYNGAQLYAFSKADLVAGDPAPTLVYLESLDVPELGQPSFTVWPARSRAGEFDASNGGVEYLVSFDGWGRLRDGEHDRAFRQDGGLGAVEHQQPGD